MDEDSVCDISRGLRRDGYLQCLLYLCSLGSCVVKADKQVVDRLDPAGFTPLVPEVSPNRTDRHFVFVSNGPFVQMHLDTPWTVSGWLKVYLGVSRVCPGPVRQCLETCPPIQILYVCQLLSNFAFLPSFQPAPSLSSQTLPNLPGQLHPAS